MANETSASTLSRADVLEVRLARREEESEWDKLMSSCHYLGYRATVGESLKYAAVLEGEIVALIGWSSAAFKNIHRDKWIGWLPAVQWKRLKFIASNSRFLILPGVRISNLASRILSLNLSRLSSDWERSYGHPVVMVETFVDPARFKGTCYRASAWQELGSTQGFGRNGGKYYYHGNPKMIFVRQLHRRARVMLTEVDSPLNEYNKEGIMDIKELSLDGKEGLVGHLMKISEPRKARGIRHNKISILAVSVCALLSGARGFAAIGEWAAGCNQNILKRLWCRIDRRTGRYVPPSEPTIRRLLQSVDAEEVDRVVGQWLQKQRKSDETEGVAIDGKTVKGARGLHLLSAFFHKEGITIAQKEVSTGGGEIPGVKQLLKDVDISGMTVTADALHTQRKTAEFIVMEKEADYFFTVKDNQSTLKQDIEAISWEAFPPSTQNSR